MSARNVPRQSPMRVQRPSGLSPKKTAPMVSSPKKAAPPPSADTKKKEESEELFTDLTDEELHELFTVVDADGGGTIDRDELKEVMVC